MKIPFTNFVLSRYNNRPTIQGISDEEQTHDSAISNIAKINSLVSDQLGIGLNDSDPLENIHSIEKNFHGSAARHIYRTLDIVQRIIDSPAKDAIRNGFKIITKHEELELGKLMLERFEDLKYKIKFRDYLINSRLYARGSLMFPVILETGMTPNRSHLTSPIHFRTLETIENLNVVPEDRFFYHVQSFDALARNFGEIDFINVSGAELDQSRFIVAVLSLDVDRQKGISILDRIITACKALNIAEWTIANLLLRYRALIIKYPSKELFQLTAKNSKAKARRKTMKVLLNDFKMKFSSKSVAAIPDGFDVQYLQTQLTGLKEATDFLYEYLATVTKIPQSKIRGTASGELASAEKDERDYNEVVKADEQIDKLEPLIQFLAPFILNEKTGKIYQILVANNIAPASVKITVEFEPLQSVNPMTDAQVKLTDSQRAAVDIAQGIRNTDEAREELYPHLEKFSSMPNMPGSNDELNQLMQMNPSSFLNSDGSVNPQFQEMLTGEFSK